MTFTPTTADVALDGREHTTPKAFHDSIADTDWTKTGLLDWSRAVVDAVTTRARKGDR